jgi:serine/threonine protein phosphatase PrpC
MEFVAQNEGSGQGENESPTEDSGVVEVLIHAVDVPANNGGPEIVAAPPAAPTAPPGNPDPIFMTVDGENFAALSVRGFKWRNEDCVVIGRAIRGDKKSLYIVVADGVSSCKNGPGASAATCATIDAFFKDPALSQEDTGQSLVRKAILLAHESVLKVPSEPDAPAEYSGPGTTVAVALIEDDSVYVGWCGDSSFYAISDTAEGRQARRLTDPHNVLYGLMRLGLTREQALEECKPEERHILERLLAPLPKGRTLEPNFVTVPLAGMVCLIGCSDGLADDVHPEETNDTSEVTALFDESDGNAEALVRLAISKASGEDNITCAAVIFNRTNGVSQ